MVVFRTRSFVRSPEAPESGLWIRRNVFGQGRTLTRGQGAERLRRSVSGSGGFLRNPEFFFRLRNLTDGVAPTAIGVASRVKAPRVRAVGRLLLAYRQAARGSG